jgi:hypothetical protein
VVSANFFTLLLGLRFSADVAAAVELCPPAPSCSSSCSDSAFRFRLLGVFVGVFTLTPFFRSDLGVMGGSRRGLLWIMIMSSGSEAGSFSDRGSGEGVFVLGLTPTMLVNRSDEALNISVQSDSN